MKLTRVEHVFDGSRIIFITRRSRAWTSGSSCAISPRTSGCGSRCARSGAGRSEDAGRLRLLRPPALLHHVAALVRADLDQMAKQQHLSLNPSKLSGQCGRLKCCLRYELPNGGRGDARRLRRPRRLLESTGCGNCGTEGGCGSGHHARGRESTTQLRNSQRPLTPQLPKLPKTPNSQFRKRTRKRSQCRTPTSWPGLEVLGVGSWWALWR